MVCIKYEHAVAKELQKIMGTQKIRENPQQK
jgi:hypothetical protein